MFILLLTRFDSDYNLLYPTESVFVFSRLQYHFLTFTHFSIPAVTAAATAFLTRSNNFIFYISRLIPVQV